MNPHIQNITLGEEVRSDKNIVGILPVLPHGEIPTPIAVKSVTTSTAVNVALSGASLIVISSEDNGCYFRFKTSSDTADVTSVDGGNARGKVLPGSQRVEALVTGATHISLLGDSGTARVTIEQRA